MKKTKRILKISITAVLIAIGMTAGGVLANDYSNEVIDGDYRKEVKYDGSDDFYYWKGSVCDDIRIENFALNTSYVKNQLVFQGKQGSSFKQIKQALEKYDGVIVGYDAEINLYQVEFLESTRQELENKIIELNNEELIRIYSTRVNEDFILELEKDDKSKDKRVEIEYTNGIEFSYNKKGEIVTEIVKGDDGKPVEIRYIKNLIMLNVDHKYSLKDVKAMAKKYEGIVVGCRPYEDYYEIEFLDCNYEELEMKVNLINSESMMQGNTAYIEKHVGIDSREEVEYDGSEDFYYWKNAICENVRIDYAEFGNAYVKNRVVFSVKLGIGFEEIKDLLKEYEGIIVGYSAEDNLYQVEFLECTKQELERKKMCLDNEELIQDYSAGLQYRFILESEEDEDNKDNRVEIEYKNGVKFSYIARGNQVKQKIETDDGKDIEFKYVENMIICNVYGNHNLDDVKKMVKKYGGIVVGSIPDYSYQVEFLNCDYEDLKEKVELINKEPMMVEGNACIDIVIPVTTCDNK